MWARIHAMSSRLLAAFTEWFCSKGGVWQTTIVTLGVVVAEMAHVIPDPHGFWVLYILTVYSAITQPALAYSGAVSSKKMEALERQNGELLAHQEQLLEHMASMREQLADNGDEERAKVQGV